MLYTITKFTLFPSTELFDQIEYYTCNKRHLINEISPHRGLLLLRIVRPWLNKEISTNCQMNEEVNKRLCYVLPDLMITHV